MNETWWVEPGQLDDAQRDVLTTDPDASLLILGPPGSGKTNILILRANYVRPVAPRVLFLTFTRVLCEFLRSGPSIGRADQLQSNEMLTFMAWSRRTIRELGGTLPEKAANFGEERENTLEELASVIDAENVGYLYDVIFVDEVQDFLKAELEVIKKISKRINAAGDSRQRIWQHREGLPTIANMTSKSVTLTEHYRIGEQICEFADQILPPKDGDSALIDGCNYDENSRTSSVRPVSCRDIDGQVEACIARIKEQRRYVTDEPIGVLSPTRQVRDIFWNAIKQDAELGPICMLQQENNYQPFGPNSLIRVMTVASAKGSEFRAVHMLDAHSYGTSRRELAFTAVTRAKTELDLYYEGALPGHMTPPTTELPSIDSIF